MDIELELKKILREAGYVAGESEIRGDIYVCLENLFRELTYSCKNVAIRCGGRHTVHLLEDFGDILDFKYIIDQDVCNVDRHIRAYNIPIVSELFDEVDAVIISTFSYRDEIRAEFTNRAVRVVDIYEYLKGNGFKLSGEYYAINTEPYRVLIEGNQRYISATDKSQKEKALDDLIWKYLDVRDLYSAEKCIEEYVYRHYDGYEKKEILHNKLRVLLQQIKELCRNRKKRDIFWFWQDGAPYNILQEMPFLKEYVKGGVFFEEAYSITSSTRGVYARILDQRDECEVYSAEYNVPKVHETIRKLNQNGYDCRKITGVRQRYIKMDSFDCYNASQMVMGNRALSELYWEALREMILCDQPVCLLIHSGMETHLPVMAPNLENYYFYDTMDIASRFEESGRKEYWERLTKTVKYVDCEMKFLFGILGDQVIKIVMSDHGDVLTKDSYYFTKDASHIILAAVGSGLSPKNYTQLFNIKNFVQLLEYIAEPTDEKEKALFSEEILFQVVDAYDEGFIRDLIFIDYAKYGLAFCGIMTGKDRFVKLGTGEEIYNVFPDDFTNCISEPAYQKRISYLRERAGEHFIDIENNEKFRYSYLLYKALGKKRILYKAGGEL